MNTEVDEAPAQTSKVRRLFRIALWSVGALMLIVITVGIQQWVTWPDVEQLTEQNPETTAFIDAYRRSASDTDGTPLHWRWVRWDRMSPNVKAAVLVAEDIEFFYHGGFSLSEIRAAIRAAWETRESPRGASTLTQQLAKNLWLSPSRNPLRKVKEALLTMQLERKLTKERVFELYLNVAEFGRGIYGVEAAANQYFDKSAEQLTRNESAMLAASLSRPSRWNPASSSPGYLARVERIENLMLRHGGYLERWVGLRPEHLATTQPDESARD